MKYLSLLIIALCSLSLNAQQRSTKDFQWLRGAWLLENPVSTETWWLTNDSTMDGVSSHVEDGKEVIDERIKIVVRGTNCYYIPQVTNQNKGKEVEFKIVSLTPTSFAAENKGHDFPQRIVYELKDAMHLYAYIEGTLKGKAKKFEFNFIKKQ